MFLTITLYSVAEKAVAISRTPNPTGIFFFLGIFCFISLGTVIWISSTCWFWEKNVRRGQLALYYCFAVYGRVCLLQPFYKTLIRFETVFCQYFRWVIVDICGDMSKPSFCLNSCPLNCVLWSDIVEISCSKNSETRFEMHNYFFISNIDLFAERDNITPGKLFSCLFW